MVFRPFLSVALLAMAMSTHPARAEVVVKHDDLFVVSHEEVIETDANSAWQALISPSLWWNGAHSFSGDAGNFTLEARAGGCFCEELPSSGRRPEAGSVKHLEVLLADPPSLLRMKGALGPLQGEPVNAVFTVSVKPEDGGVKIAFEYAVGGPSRYDLSQIAPAVDAVIGEQLERLADILSKSQQD